MKLTHIVLAGMIPLIFVGCSFVDIPSVNDLPFIHRIDVQQGNVITQNMLAQLKPNMEKKKVSFIMGTSVVMDTFNSDQWDYVYSFRYGGRHTERRRVTLHFDENGLLNSITGDINLAESPLIPRIHKDTKIEVPRFKAKTFSTKLKEKLPFVEKSSEEIEASESETEEYASKVTKIQENRRKAGTDIRAGLQPAPGEKVIKNNKEKGTLSKIFRSSDEKEKDKPNKKI